MSCQQTCQHEASRCGPHLLSRDAPGVPLVPVPPSSEGGLHTPSPLLLDSVPRCLESEPHSMVFCSVTVQSCEARTGSGPRVRNSTESLGTLQRVRESPRPFFDALLSAAATWGSPTLPLSSHLTGEDEGLDGSHGLLRR